MTFSLKEFPCAITQHIAEDVFGVCRSARSGSNATAVPSAPLSGMPAPTGKPSNLLT